ncbi:hypothetical protein J6590_068871 [Homalodisca vitripennis]|nr:hypothetical protein J6590_068871 [Homalodisca vitripennis]
MVGRPTMSMTLPSAEAYCKGILSGVLRNGREGLSTTGVWSVRWRGRHPCHYRQTIGSSPVLRVVCIDLVSVTLFCRVNNESGTDLDLDKMSNGDWASKHSLIVHARYGRGSGLQYGRSAMIHYCPLATTRNSHHNLYSAENSLVSKAVQYAIVKRKHPHLLA